MFWLNIILCFGSISFYVLARFHFMFWLDPAVIKFITVTLGANILKPAARSACLMYNGHESQNP